MGSSHPGTEKQGFTIHPMILGTVRGPTDLPERLGVQGRRAGHPSRSGQATSWKPPRFFRETHVIKENVVSRSSVVHLLEFVLEAALYGKNLPILSAGVCLLPGMLESHRRPANTGNESLPLFVLEQGDSLQNLKLLANI